MKATEEQIQRWFDHHRDWFSHFLLDLFPDGKSVSINHMPFSYFFTFKKKLIAKLELIDNTDYPYITPADMVYFETANVLMPHPPNIPLKNEYALCYFGHFAEDFHPHRNQVCMVDEVTRDTRFLPARSELFISEYRLFANNSDKHSPTLKR